jgi:hypothetical protein
VGYPFELRLYAWDITSGVVTPTPVKSYDSTFFQASGFPPGRMFRARFQVTNSALGLGNLWLGSDDCAFQCGYNAAFPDSLSFLGWWKSDHTGEIQDMQVYDFGAGPRVLVGTNTRSFAWVIPN